MRNVRLNIRKKKKVSIEISILIIMGLFFSEIAPADAKASKDTLEPRPSETSPTVSSGGKTQSAAQKNQLNQRSPSKAAPQSKPFKKGPTAPSLKNILKELKSLDLKVDSPHDKKERKTVTPDNITVSFYESEGFLNLMFQPRFYAPMAVFRRGDVLWFVIDTSEFPLRFMTAEDVNQETDLMIFPNKNFTAIRISSNKAVEEISLENGLAYAFVSEYEQKRKYFSFDLQRNDPSSIQIPIKKSRLIEWRDPDVGDLIFVAPTLSQGTGIGELHQWVDFNLLPSYQGVVLKPLSADLKYDVTEEKLTFTRPEGLRLQKTIPKKRSLIRETFFNFQGLEQLNNQSIRRLQEKLANNISRATPAEKKEIYLDYGRALLSRDQFKEAQGYFSLAMSIHTLGKQDWIYRAYFGLASLLADDYAAAVEAFSSHKLELDPEIVFLRSVVAARQENWKKAAIAFPYAIQFLRDYPDNIRMKIGLDILSASMALGERTVSNQILDLLKQTKASSLIFSDRLKLFEAKTLWARKNYPEAERLLEALEKSPYPPVQVESTHFLVTNKLESGSISNKDALQKLDRLKRFWIEDERSTPVVESFISLLLKEKEVSRALETLLSGHSRSSSKEKKIYFGNKIREVFIEIFSQPLNGSLSSVEMLSLYLRYKNFLRFMDDLNKVLNPLVSRLESMDLLPQAIDVIEDVLPELRDRNSKDLPDFLYRLAQLYLAEGNSAKSLSVIEENRLEEKAPHLSAGIKYLRTKILIHQEKYQNALTLLQHDESAYGLSMKGDLYWLMKDWPNVITALKSLIPFVSEETEKDSTVISPKKSELIVMMAIAYNNLGNINALHALNQEYGEAMAKSRHGRHFQALVSDQAHLTHGTSQQIEDHLKTTDIFKKLMNNFPQ